MKFSTKAAFLYLFASFFLFSCVSRKKLVYLQDIDNQKNYDSSLRYEPTLQPDDLLNVIVSAENPEVTVPFNLPQIQGNYQLNENQSNIKTYLIDNDGFIEFPVIGKVKLGGLTRSQAISTLADKVSFYIKNPSINLRILNYKISILGQVSKPGSYTIPSERITILEALSLSGDLTLYGKRNNILLIHEEEGKKTYTRIDLTKVDILNLENYYLAQNDIIYVEPNKTAINSSAVGPNTALYLSGLTVILSLILVLKN
ncbi:MAG: polysaccharide biosynthesis/export family protein [Flavobacterium sp.]|nr:polysaccharide biosynthesis/export family protein [Flavobacterium sp.]